MKKIISLKILILLFSAINIIMIALFFTTKNVIYILIYLFFYCLLFIIKYLESKSRILYIHVKAQEIENKNLKKITDITLKELNNEYFNKYLLNYKNFDIRTFVEAKLLIIDIFQILLIVLVYITLILYNDFITGITFLIFILPIIFFASLGVNELYNMQEKTVSEESDIIKLEEKFNNYHSVFSIFLNKQADTILEGISTSVSKINKFRFKILMKADFLYNISSIMIIVLFLVVFYRFSSGFLAIGTTLIILQFLLSIVPSIEDISNKYYSYSKNNSVYKYYDEIIKNIQTNNFLKTDDKFLKLETLNLKYKTLEYPNIVIQKNEKIQITGANGIGKTTFILLLSGYLKGDFGRIMTNEKEQSINQYTSISILNNKEFILDFDISPKIFFELKNGNIGSNINDGIKLSVGQIQKVNIELALLNDRDIYVFDEPVSNLDEESKQRFIKYLNELQKTIIIISHDEIDEFKADQIIKLGGTDEIFENQ